MKKQNISPQAIEESLKKDPIIARKPHGNLLFPMFIVLGISAASTAVFINQARNLAADNTKIMAQNEITYMMNQWNILTLSVAARDVTDDTGKATSAPISMTTVNAYGVANDFRVPPPRLIYTTDSETTCKELKKLFIHTSGVDAALTFCGDGVTNKVSNKKVLALFLR